MNYLLRFAVLLVFLCLSLAHPLAAQGPAAEKKILWKPVPFAILKFNDQAPKSWNMYHSDKRGMILLHLWKRYLMLDLEEQEAYDIDPDQVKPQGENVEFPGSAIPNDSIEVSEWKARGVGQLERIRFRFGKAGHFLDIQLPLRPDGKSLY